MTDKEFNSFRHQKLLKITGKLWLLLVKNATELPDDARIRGARYDAFHDMLEFVVESDEFPEVEEGVELKPLFGEGLP